MSEIAQLFESALRNNRATLLRQAALRTLERMPADTTIRDLMQSEAAAAIRELTLDDLAEGLTAEGSPSDDVASGASTRTRRLRIEAAPATTSASREEALYREILDALSGAPMTIGQLAKQLALDTEEVRGYLAWMKKMGKVASTGRARATRYQACV